MTKQTFQRGERLKSRKLIEQLFQKGQSFGTYPLRLVWMEVESPQSDYPVQFTVSVSKRKFKRAVQRNRLKRQVREAWRLQKAGLYAKLPEGKQFAFLVIYTGKEAFDYAVIEKAMRKMIRRFLDTYEKSN